MHNLMPSPIVVPVITAGAYSANDVVGGLLTFQLAPEAPAGVNPASGFVVVVTISDDDNEKAALELHLFREAPTAIADNAAFAPTFADLKKRIGSVAIAAGDYVTINSNAQAVKSGIEMEFYAPNGVLYGYLVATGTPTYSATSDLAIALTAYLI